MKQCAICGKRPVVGRTVTHRGKLKKQGGVGRRTVRTSLRRFLPNLQRIMALRNGTVKRIRVCTSCLRSGLVQRPLRRPSRQAPSARAASLPQQA